MINTAVQGSNALNISSSKVLDIETETTMAADLPTEQNAMLLTVVTSAWIIWVIFILRVFGGTLRRMKSRNEPVYVMLIFLSILSLLAVSLGAVIVHLRGMAASNDFCFCMGFAVMLFACVVLPLLGFKLVEIVITPINDGETRSEKEIEADENNPKAMEAANRLDMLLY